LSAAGCFQIGQTGFFYLIFPVFSSHFSSRFAGFFGFSQDVDGEKTKLPENNLRQSFSSSFLLIV
jgi:hypothetical protein